MRRTTTLLLVGTLGAACNRSMEPETNETETPEPKDTSVATAPAEPAEVEPRPTREGADPGTVPAAVTVENLGRFRVAPELQKSVSRALAVADANGDGKITRDEANSGLNFVIGGFFFRADADGDGKITPEERKEARAEFARNNPELDNLLVSFADSGPVKALMERLDTDVEETLDLKQTRSAIRRAVDGIYDAVDKNSDDTITVEEADRGFNVAAAKLGRAAFSKADADDDGKMTLKEFQAALDGPLQRAFEAADANDDGQLSDDEAASMMWWLSERVDAAAERGYQVISDVTEASSIRK